MAGREWVRTLFLPAKIVRWIRCFSGDLSYRSQTDPIPTKRKGFSARKSCISKPRESRTNPAAYGTIEWFFDRSRKPAGLTTFRSVGTSIDAISRMRVGVSDEWHLLPRNWASRSDIGTSGTACMMVVATVLLTRNHSRSRCRLHQRAPWRLRWVRAIVITRQTSGRQAVRTIDQAPTQHRPLATAEADRHRHDGNQPPS